MLTRSALVRQLKEKKENQHYKIDDVNMIKLIISLYHQTLYPSYLVRLVHTPSEETILPLYKSLIKRDLSDPSGRKTLSLWTNEPIQLTSFDQPLTLEK